MANYATQIISCEGLKTKLTDRGVIEHVKDNCYFLKLPLCSDEWFDEKNRILEKGILNTFTGERKSYSQEQSDELDNWQIKFRDENTALYFTKWASNDTGMYYMSKALPDEKIKYEVYYENEFDGEAYVRNGESIEFVFVRNKDEIRHCEVLERNKTEVKIDFDNKIMTIPSEKAFKHYEDCILSEFSEKIENAFYRKVEDEYGTKIEKCILIESSEDSESIIMLSDFNCRPSIKIKDAVTKHPIKTHYKTFEDCAYDENEYITCVSSSNVQEIPF